MRLRYSHGLLRRSVRGAEHLLGFARVEQRDDAALRLAMVAHGFHSHRARLYPFDRYDLRWFLSDWTVEHRFPGINPPDAAVQLSNKLFLHVLLRELGRPGKLPPLIGIVSDGRFTPLSLYASLEAAIAAHRRVIVKPVGGCGGAGVTRIGPGDALPAGGIHVVEAVLEQHPYAAAIYPGALNTIRVLVLRRDHEPPFIAAAAHRFGNSRTGAVDNLARGGISTLVDLETGTLSAGRSIPGFHSGVQHDRHPDTGAAFEGVEVPRWNEVKALALELMLLVPGLQIAGWDVCVTRDGPRVIEGNGIPDPDVIQTHRPLLLDARTREFFHAKGVISDRRFRTLERLAAQGQRGLPDGGANGSEFARGTGDLAGTTHVAER